VVGLYTTKVFGYLCGAAAPLYISLVYKAFPPLSGGIQSSHKKNKKKEEDYLIPGDDDQNQIGLSVSQRDVTIR
jgi:hypothetical protein